MSPRLPRNLDGAELARALERLGYRVTRQAGSHIRMTTDTGGQHHVTIPAHKPLRVGTLAAILAEVASHFAMDRDDLLRTLFE